MILGFKSYPSKKETNFPISNRLSNKSNKMSVFHLATTIWLLSEYAPVFSV